MNSSITIGTTIRLLPAVAAGWQCPEGRQDNKTATVAALLEDGGIRTDDDLGGCRYWHVSDVEAVEAGVVDMIEQAEAVTREFSVNVFRRGRMASYLVAAHHGIRAVSAEAAIEVARMFHPPKAVGLSFEAVGGAA